MIKIRKNNFIEKVFYNKKFVAFIGFIFILAISFPLAKQISKRYYIDEEIKELENEISSLESQNGNLKDFISYLESDSFIEEQARLNLGLKKEGEKVVVIKEAEIKENLILTEENEKRTSNPARWWKYFFVK